METEKKQETSLTEDVMQEKLHETTVVHNAIDKEVLNIEEEEMRNTKFSELSERDKARVIIISILKFIGLLGALYFFVCSLDIMSLSFRLVGGKKVTEFFQSDLIKNPVAGLMIGIIVTVVVQSSSTSTSIIVTMVSAQLLEVRQAIPIIMGANIGTSITSTLVSLGHLGQKEDFRRAFCGAIVHDIFNFLSVIILLPLELISRYSETVSGEIVKLIKLNTTVKEPEMLNAITKPLTNKIIQLDRKVLDSIAQNTAIGNESLIKRVCSVKNNSYINENNVTIISLLNVKCDFIFSTVSWPDWGVGLLLLIVSLIALTTCLIILVKILSSVFKGHLKNILQKTVNADFPGPFKYLTPYVAICLGCILTITVQSSSVFTSALVPLVSMGLFSLERVFPLILGSNIGTTITGILAAFSASSKTVKLSLQIALCHSLFNVTGIIIWYPIPYLRRVPLKIATYLSVVTEKYRWFAIVYLILVFIFMPLFVFSLSLAGILVMGIVLGVIVLFIIFIAVVNVLQNKKPSILPSILRTWNFLPRPLRSLEPYDYIFTRYILCCKTCKTQNNKVDPIDIDEYVEKVIIETNEVEKNAQFTDYKLTIESDKEKPKIVTSMF